MSAVLLDTHVWVWTWSHSDRLSPLAQEAVASAETIYISPVSVFEVSQKARLGKWPEVESEAGDLTPLIAGQGATEAPLNAETCSIAGWLAWPHRDPFDRLIAATALHLSIPLVTKDTAFASLEGLDTIW